MDKTKRLTGEPQKPDLLQVLKPYLALTFIFSIAAFLIFFSVKLFVPEPEPEISSKNFNTYFNELTEEELIEFLTQNQEYDYRLYKQEIIEYLINENIDCYEVSKQFKNKKP